MVSYRNTKDLDLDSLNNQLSRSLLHSENESCNSVDEFVNRFLKITKDTFDEVAPIQTRFVTHRPCTRWYNSDLREAKRAKRRAERRYRKTGLTVYYDMYVNQCREYNNLLDEAKTSHYKSIIDNCSRNQLYKITDNFFILNNNNVSMDGSIEHLVEKFNDFFIQKIVNIRNELSEVMPQPRADILDASRPSSPRCQFSAFEAVSCSTLHDLILSLPSKSCSLDSIPTHVFKQLVDTLCPTLNRVVNLSLSSGEFPSAFKLSLVRPLLKKPNLDPAVFKHYRPVSNIPFVSKVLEKVVADQTLGYLESNHLLPHMQSAYRKNHSTETALIKVVNDILVSVDNNSDVLLILLDLSAAFDTIDHSFLLARLSSYFGFSGNVLHWYQSYLTGRHQSVMIDGTISSERRVVYGVPQGSVLGPLLFVLYLAPLQEVILRHNLHCMFYADDTQLYISIDRDDPNLSLDSIRLCVNDVILWLRNNLLACNPDKTEIILFSSRFTSGVVVESFAVENFHIQVSNSVSNLGVVLDKYLSFSKQINHICRKATLAMKYISRIRKYLSKDNLTRLVNTMVISHLDHCNGILYGLPEKEIFKLQRVQNCAARLITGTGRYEHITPVLKDLHWLPVRSRLTFKILLTTYKILYGLAPFYMSSLLSVRQSVRSLRSSNKSLLSIPSVKTKSYGQRAFSYCAPLLWNGLPEVIKCSPTLYSFKSALKTHLFRQCYEC